MWHLQVLQKGSTNVDYEFLFHTLDDVANFILNANELSDYRMSFIRIWVEPESKVEVIESHPFKFPEPLSGVE